MTAAQVHEKVRAIRQHANEITFPALIKEVQAGLASKILFETEISSLNRMRNCLEHRNGVVEERDIDSNGELSLTLPGMQAFAVVDGKEVEVGPGFVTKEDTDVYIRRINRTRIFKLGEHVRIDAAEFQEIAFACHLFADDLANKLPTVPIRQPKQ